MKEEATYFMLVNNSFSARLNSFFVVKSDSVCPSCMLVKG